MGLRVAVVGATGNVGREMLTILEERLFPADEVIALASRRSVGVEVSYGDKTLKVKDLPEVWNAKYREYLGVTPPDDARGVLQDVHWSGAAFGYFPSYTLGNLYAASIGAAMQTDVPDLWPRVEGGDFAPILSWLREKVHRQGHFSEAPEIIRAAVGERDHVEDLLAYLWGRHGALYGVKRVAG